MRLLSVKNLQLTDTGIHYRKHYKAHALFINSMNDMEFDFDFWVEKDAVDKKEIIISLEDNLNYPIITLKNQLKEWVKDNISI